MDCLELDMNITEEPWMLFSGTFVRLAGKLSTTYVVDSVQCEQIAGR